MTVTISYPDSLLQKAVSQQPCNAGRFFIHLSKKALVPVLTLLPGTVQSWPDSYLSDHGRDWPGGHFCTPICRFPPYQAGPSLPHCSCKGCCQLLFPTGHWPLFPYIYSPKETLPATTATEAVEEESASEAGHQAHQFDKSWEKGNQGRGTIAAFLGVSASYGRSQKRSKDRSQGQIQGHQVFGRDMRQRDMELQERRTIVMV